MEIPLPILQTGRAGESSIRILLFRPDHYLSSAIGSLRRPDAANLREIDSRHYRNSGKYFFDYLILWN